MSDLFEEVEVIEVVDGAEDLEVGDDLAEAPVAIVDARRRLELLLEEKRLRDELEVNAIYPQRGRVYRLEL